MIALFRLGSDLLIARKKIGFILWKYNF